MATDAARAPGTARLRAAAPPRFFSSPPGEPRSRRATDAIVLAVALAALVAMTAAYGPAEVDRTFAAFIASLPGWLDPVWRALTVLLDAWALVLLAVPVLGRRPSLAAEALAALVLAVALAAACARAGTGAWPDAGDLLRRAADAPAYPAFALAEAAAVILAVIPHLVRPLRSFGWWVIILGIAGALLAGDATLLGSLAAILAGVVAAATVRLWRGTSVGRLGAGALAAELDDLGVSLSGLEALAPGASGVVSYRGRDAVGRDVLVSVHGRDAYDNQVLATAWRALAYRDDGPTLALSRVQGVEHEALVTLLARRAGVPTRDVITAGATAEGDAILVLDDTAVPLAGVPAGVREDALAGCWEALRRLAGAGVAHLRISPEALVLVDGEPGLVGFAGATLSPTVDQLQADRAQLLASTAALAGSGPALAAAEGSLADEGLAALLPYLQPAAFGGALRRALKSAGVDIGALRADAAAAAGVAPPEPVRLRRVTPASLLQALLLGLAVAAIAPALAGVDLAQLRDTLDGALWGWIALAFAVAQLPRVGLAFSTLASILARLAFGPVYMMQLAVAYLNLVVPSNVARIAVNVRFFQKQGVPPPSAVASGAVESLVGNAVQVALLGSLLLLTDNTIAFDLGGGGGGGGGAARLLLAAAALVVAGAVAVAAVPRLRRRVVAPVRRWWPEMRDTVAGLRRLDKLGVMVLGNVAAEVLTATALGLFVAAFGEHVPLGELLVVTISVSLLASFVPVPGGIGVVEWGLTAGLIAYGVPEAAAVSAVISYRLATFYLPPIWGWFALRWLRARSFL